jgi:hypothetical protein
MKTLLLAVTAIVIASASVNAQEKQMKSNGPKISIAGNIGTGTKSGYTTSYGADLQADFPVTTGLDITASAGYQNFHFKSGNVNFDQSYIPVLAGAKVPFGKGFYGHGQLGYAFLTNKIAGRNQNNGDFSFAPSLGYGFGKNFDVSVKYLSVDVINAVLLRLAYNF